MNEEDRKTLDRMMIYGGSFAANLAHAAGYADSDNLETLKKAFPGLWLRYGATGSFAKEVTK